MTVETVTTPQTRSNVTSRAGSSASNRSGSSFVLHPFGFDAKVSYDATRSLSNLRSANVCLKQPIKDDNIWKRPPPDFRPQCYVPNPPKRNSRESMKPWKYGTIPGEKIIKQTSEATLKLPRILQPSPIEEDKFVTSFRIPGAWEGKLDFVKEGMYRPGPYANPKPHDFRGYPPIQSLGLPEFETDYEHDPFNIRFLSSNLDILPGDGPVVREEREIRGTQMAPPMSPQLHWDPRLILPHERFPNKYKAYTRYRPMDRGPQSALMDRVEEKLSAQWAKEQLERQLTIHTYKSPQHGGQSMSTGKVKDLSEELDKGDKVAPDGSLDDSKTTVS